MSWASALQVAPDDRTAGDDCLASEDDVLRACDRRSARYLVACVLHLGSQLALVFGRQSIIIGRTVSMNSALG